MKKLIIILTLNLAAAVPSFAALNPEREAYYGETHLHTSWSFDAFIFGDHKSTPGDAYDYAKGKPIKHALGFEMKITQPLDWMGVTDHSEYVGVIQQANTPGTPLSQTELGKKLIVRDNADIQRIYIFLGTTMVVNKPIPELVAPALASTVWDKNNAYADAANEPGKFTAFNSYEWTSTPTIRTCIGTFFSRTARSCRRCRSVPSTRSRRKICGTGWMNSASKASNCSPFRITPTCPTG